MPLRILHIIATLDRAGAEKQLALLAAGLPRDRFDVHVCALTRGGPLEAELRAAEIPVNVIGKRFKFDPFAFVRLRRHIRRLRPDIVQTWMFTANSYGITAAKSEGVKHILSGERCVDRWKSGWQLSLDRHLSRWVEATIVNSSSVRDFYIARGLPAEKFIVIPGGGPSSRPSDVPRESLLDELDIPRDAWLIGAIGRLWPQKRIKDLIWAADLAHLLHEKAMLVVLGDGPERAMLERFTRLIEAQGHVRFLGHRDDVWRIIPHLDVLWLGSQYEGLSNSVMEAMAAGVPVVASDIPEMRELVIDGETGFLVPIGGRAARVRATDKIIGDEKFARRLGESARGRAAEKFSVERMIRSHANLYEEIAGKK